jgi:hypothetical protein
LYLRGLELLLRRDDSCAKRNEWAVVWCKGGDIQEKTNPAMAGLVFDLRPLLLRGRACMLMPYYLFCKLDIGPIMASCVPDG